MKPTAYRERIYDLFADPAMDFETRVTRALALGTEYLGLPIGFLTRIEGGTQEIVHSVGDHRLIRPGETCPLDSAYCRRTVERETPLAIQNAGASTAVSESAVELFDLGTYVGAKVVVDDEVYGTVCFADDEARGEAFTEAETHFVELLARLVGQAIERREYERELARRERRLHERRELYRSVIDASFDLVFRIDAEGRFTYVSPPIEKLLGYPPEYYVDHPFTSMLPDEETVDLAGELYERVMAGETVQQEFFPLDHREDRRVLVDVRVTPVYDGSVPPVERTGADVVGAQGMARDATDRWRRERLVRVLNRVLRHNLRNEVNVISGFAEVLRERLSGEEEAFARRIVETSDHLASLSETARALEDNLDADPTLEPVDVVPAVRRAANRVDEQYPAASVSVTAPEEATARCAPRFEAAVLELLENAAAHAGDSPTIEVSVTADDGRVTVSVADDGPGLPDQERAVLETGEESPLIHGSGLGLWLVYWIVQSLRGDLEVREAPPGTTVEIRLQRPSSLGRRPDSARRPPGRDSRNRKP